MWLNIFIFSLIDNHKHVITVILINHLIDIKVVISTTIHGTVSWPWRTSSVGSYKYGQNQPFDPTGTVCVPGSTILFSPVFLYSTNAPTIYFQFVSKFVRLYGMVLYKVNYHSSATLLEDIYETE